MQARRALGLGIIAAVIMALTPMTRGLGQPTERALVSTHVIASENEAQATVEPAPREPVAVETATSNPWYGTLDFSQHQEASDSSGNFLKVDATLHFSTPASGQPTVNGSIKYRQGNTGGCIYTDKGTWTTPQPADPISVQLNEDGSYFVEGRATLVTLATWNSESCGPTNSVERIVIVSVSQPAGSASPTTTVLSGTGPASWNFADSYGATATWNLTRNLDAPPTCTASSPHINIVFAHDGFAKFADISAAAAGHCWKPINEFKGQNGTSYTCPAKAKDPIDPASPVDLFTDETNGTNKALWVYEETDASLRSLAQDTKAVNDCFVPDSGGQTRDGIQFSAQRNYEYMAAQSVDGSAGNLWRKVVPSTAANRANTKYFAEIYSGGCIGKSFQTCFGYWQARKSVGAPMIDVSTGRVALADVTSNVLEACQAIKNGGKWMAVWSNSSTALGGSTDTEKRLDKIISALNSCVG